MEYTVDAVNKAIKLLLFVAEHPGLGVTELARRAEITKARSHRLLETLEHSGLVRREGAAAIYFLSHKGLFLGIRATDQLELVRLGRKYLHSLGRRVNENVSVQIRDGLERVCVARWDSHHEVRLFNRELVRRPLHAGASGKLLLAHAPEDVRRVVVSGVLTSYTRNTLSSTEALLRELEVIRKRGYSVSEGEVVEDAVAIAVPVKDETDVVIATLSLSAPRYRISKGEINRFVRLLRSSATRLSIELRRAVRSPS